MSSCHDFEEMPVHCAFCGESDLLIMDDEAKYYVLCLGCRACGPCVDSREEAMLSWCDRYDPADSRVIFTRAARLVHGLF